RRHTRSERDWSSDVCSSDLAADTAGHPHAEPAVEEEKTHGVIGEAWSAALSSFCFFATGALIPIIPYIFGMDVLPGAVVAMVLRSEERRVGRSARIRRGLDT